jgi:hypothetical protein
MSELSCDTPFIGQIETHDLVRVTKSIFYPCKNADHLKHLSSQSPPAIFTRAAKHAQLDSCSATLANDPLNPQSCSHS